MQLPPAPPTSIAFAAVHWTATDIINVIHELPGIIAACAGAFTMIWNARHIQRQGAQQSTPPTQTPTP